ncbi:MULTISPECIES: methyltransferase domain-containing protein [Streptomyces]|uniref:Protein-L-isoaspartate O-methyltransferase n=1 Tax=Streptomyces luteosporeus TaxID=173856 RepID=A0ABN3TWA8_9ACTN
MHRDSAEQAALHGLLDSIRATNGPIAPHWEAALKAAPRHLFLPRTIWQQDEGGTYVQVSADSEPGRWLDLAYSNDAVVTQINDGKPVASGDDVLPSSSASDPSIVVRMLTMLDPRPGQKVLEIGTGTGWNCGLLAHAIGGQNVTSIEVDTDVAAHAADALAHAGLKPHLVVADGAGGWPPHAPYDHVLATCAVSNVPSAWLEQTRPGGTILVPWNSPWCDYGLLHLTVQDDHTAEGRFSPYSAFMLMRTQRRDIRLFRDVVHDEHQPAESRTTLSPWTVAGDDYDAQFAIGLRLPDLWFAWHHDPELDDVQTRLWVATTDTSSWAAIDYDGHQDNEFIVWQHGPRRLWDEIKDAWAWYDQRSRPNPGRFGMTITPDGTHRAWLDEPGNQVPG